MYLAPGEGCGRKHISHVRAVGTCLEGPAAAGPIFGQQTRAKCRMSFGGLFNSCSKSTLAGISEDSCHPKNFWWGLEANTLCCLPKDLVEAQLFGKTTVNCSQLIVNTRAITAANTIKRADVVPRSQA